MSDDINNKISEHNFRIGALEENSQKMIDAMSALTDAINKQTTQFAVYASKHDDVSAELKMVKAKIDGHGLDLAAIKPIVEGVRGLVWKVVTAAVLGGSGVAAAIIAMIGK